MRVRGSRCQCGGTGGGVWWCSSCSCGSSRCSGLQAQPQPPRHPPPPSPPPPLPLPPPPLMQSPPQPFWSAGHAGSAAQAAQCPAADAGAGAKRSGVSCVQRRIKLLFLYHLVSPRSGPTLPTVLPLSCTAPASAGIHSSPVLMGGPQPARSSSLHDTSVTLCQCFADSGSSGATAPSAHCCAWACAIWLALPRQARPGQPRRCPVPLRPTRALPTPACPALLVLPRPTLPGTGQNRPTPPGFSPAPAGLKWPGVGQGGGSRP